MGIDGNTWALIAVGVINAFVAVMTWVNTKTQREMSDKIDIVKSQNDGVIARLGLTADASREEAKLATAAAAIAKAETIAAQVAGVAGVAEANRNNEAAAGAIKEGAQAAVEPIAEEAVAKGAEEAVTRLKREETKE